MGRLLFERRRYEGFWVASGLAVVGGSAGAVLLADRGDAAPLGVVLLAAAVVSLLLGMVCGRYRFRCHELGLVRRRAGREIRLRYDEITELTYSAKRIFYKGSYVGTRLNLTFRAPQAAIVYSAKVQNMDADLDELRDNVARAIADRMLSELRCGRVVQWLSDVALLPQGVQFRRSRMLGLASGPPEVLPYDQVRGANIDQGAFHLFSKAEAKPVLSKPANSANFFPGFFAVLTMQELAEKGGWRSPQEEAVIEE